MPKADQPPAEKTSAVIKTPKPSFADLVAKNDSQFSRYVKLER